jgi:putative ubiquitin-RnfH superfamily antitoxin RatB of RatAB toxin-antitoxin module
MAEGTIVVEVAYALPEQQRIVEVEVAPGTLAIDVVKQSGITKFFPDIDIDAAKLGLFGKAIKPKTYEVEEGDRIEIYRPLIADPKASRKARADKKASTEKK